MSVPDMSKGVAMYSVNQAVVNSILLCLLAVWPWEDS